MSEDRRKKFWKLLTEANWEKAQPEIKSWEDIIEGDLDEWLSDPETAEANNQTFHQERHADLELLNTINRERDQGLKALRATKTMAEVSRVTAIFYDCLSKWESAALEPNSSQGRIETAISRAQSMFAETSRLAQDRLGRVQAAQELHAQRKAQERATFQQIAEKNRETNEYIRGLQEDTQRKAKESRDRQHEMWMASHLGVHSQCARCCKAKLVGHRYCYDCERGRSGFAWA